MSLSRNEINTIKKAVKEAIEVYVDIKIANAQYAFTEIATVTKENWDDLSNDIEVKGKATYTHVISVGKIVYPVGSVVYCFIPNNQYNNMFILGKLDKVPAQITGGTIGIGRIGTTEPPRYNFYVDSDGNVTINKGSINLGNGNFVVDNQGNVTINQGSIHLGWNGSGYNFSVENDGEMTAYNGHFTGNVTALSGEIGKFKISVTDGLLEYENPILNHYVYLGKASDEECGFYISNQPMDSEDVDKYVSINNSSIIMGDADAFSTIKPRVIRIVNDSGILQLNSNSLNFIQNSGSLQNIGEIEFADGQPIQGADNRMYFWKRGTEWVVVKNENEKFVPTCQAIYNTINNVKTCIDEKYNDLYNQLGITAGKNGTTTLSTSGTSSYYMSSYGGKITSTYGHQLAIPSSGTSSDIRLKEQISDMPNIEDVYNNIKLHKFKYHKDIVDTLPTYHWGIIAQELEENLKKNGYNEDDYSIVFKGNQNSGYNEDKYVGDDKVYRLWSSDFDAMHIQMIQKLWKRCDELEKEIKELKEERGDK